MPDDVAIMARAADPDKDKSPALSIDYLYVNFDKVIEQLAVYGLTYGTDYTIDVQPIKNEKGASVDVIVDFKEASVKFKGADDEAKAEGVDKDATKRLTFTMTLEEDVKEGTTDSKGVEAPVAVEDVDADTVYPPEDYTEVDDETYAGSITDDMSIVVEGDEVTITGDIKAIEDAIKDIIKDFEYDKTDLKKSNLGGLGIADGENKKGSHDVCLKVAWLAPDPGTGADGKALTIKKCEVYMGEEFKDMVGTSDSSNKGLYDGSVTTEHVWFYPPVGYVTIDGKTITKFEPLTENKEWTFKIVWTLSDEEGTTIEQIRTVTLDLGIKK